MDTDEELMKLYKDELGSEDWLRKRQEEVLSPPLPVFCARSEVLPVYCICFSSVGWNCVMFYGFFLRTDSIVFWFFVLILSAPSPIVTV